MRTVPLTSDDLDMLKFMYRKRQRFFVQVCIGLLVMSLYTSYKAFWRTFSERGISIDERIVFR